MEYFAYQKYPKHFTIQIQLALKLFSWHNFTSALSYCFMPISIIIFWIHTPSALATFKVYLLNTFSAETLTSASPGFLSYVFSLQDSRFATLRTPECVECCCWQLQQSCPATLLLLPQTQPLTLSFKTHFKTTLKTVFQAYFTNAVLPLNSQRKCKWSPAFIISSNFIYSFFPWTMFHIFKFHETIFSLIFIPYQSALLTVLKIKYIHCTMYLYPFWKKIF